MGVKGVRSGQVNTVPGAACGREDPTRTAKIQIQESDLASPNTDTFVTAVGKVWSIIKPVVTYACEAWVLKGTIKYKLMVFERNVLKRL
jgi:hypothetical protein